MIGDDIRIGMDAALEDLIATCESDAGQFRRDNLTPEQNVIMWDELRRLQNELEGRREALKRDT